MSSKEVERLEKEYNDSIEKVEKAVEAKRAAKRALDTALEAERREAVLASYGIEGARAANVEIEPVKIDVEVNNG